VPSLSLAAADTTIDAGAVKLAPFVGLLIETDGGTFGGVTVTETGADVVVAPMLSVATAVSVCEPITLPLHVKLYGAAASEPTRRRPRRSPPAAPTPSVSAAVASTTTDAGVVNDAPAAGDAIATDGGEFAPELMPHARLR
jgi:hypothetical protein